NAPPEEEAVTPSPRCARCGPDNGHKKVFASDPFNSCVYCGMREYWTESDPSKGYDTLDIGNGDTVKIPKGWRYVRGWDRHPCPRVFDFEVSSSPPASRPEAKADDGPAYVAPKEGGGK
ncbi:MAG: hypothetical protein L3K18_09455, partial [Thermoplasmata archaeon]|nr:hypothetical protein [Thermoplasmata archaeon]